MISKQQYAKAVDKFNAVMHAHSQYLRVMYVDQSTPEGRADVANGLFTAQRDFISFLAGLTDYSDTANNQDQKNDHVDEENERQIRHLGSLETER